LAVPRGRRFSAFSMLVRAFSKARSKARISVRGAPSSFPRFHKLRRWEGEGRRHQAGSPEGDGGRGGAAKRALAVSAASVSRWRKALNATISREVELASSVKGWRKEGVGVSVPSIWGAPPPFLSFRLLPRPRSSSSPPSFPSLPSLSSPFSSSPSPSTALITGFNA
jgi:hypothetical protein